MRGVRRLRGPLSILLAVLAAVAGGTAALAAYAHEQRLSLGEVRLSSDVGHRGALDLYVPLVDWGVRFHAVRLPVRLRADVRSIDRVTALRVGQAGRVDVAAVRDEARDALAGYIRRAVLAVLVGALGLGLLVALAARGPALVLSSCAAAAAAVGCAIAVAVLLPPRGDLREPVFYAQGSDIPRALEAVRDVGASARVLGDELDAQLVGLARLVSVPGRRVPVEGLPRATIASDLHNNLLVLPVLERAARGGPLLFVGDLTDRGTPLETALTRRIVRAGAPFVFVPGNHDSDVLLSRLAREGAVVLGTEGRLGVDGRRGGVVADVDGLRIAGFDDPNMRRRADGYADRGAEVTAAGRRRFAGWLRPLVGRVDVVMVHDPRLLDLALAELGVRPPPGPLVFVVGHTHVPGVRRVGADVTIVNGGTVGAGGTGNLRDGDDVGLGRLAYATAPFAPLSADLVAIDPGTGSSRAERIRLDTPAGDDALGPPAPADR
jgi:predicted phosphodiesterase